MAHYEIRVSGTLPCDALAEAGYLTAEPQPVQTVLSGMMDQPALTKLLTRLELFGAHVIEMRLGRPSCPSGSGWRPSPPGG
jgi:hypothetical protein